MRLINWFINRYATPALILGGILSGIFAVILSISLLFNLNPYVKIGKSNFGFTNYDQSIPVCDHTGKDINLLSAQVAAADEEPIASLSLG